MRETLQDIYDTSADRAEAETAALAAARDAEKTSVEQARAHERSVADAARRKTDEAGDATRTAQRAAQEAIAIAERAATEARDRHAEVAPQPPRHAQLLALVLCGQAVTALDLDGAHAFGQQGLQARRGGGKQLVLAGLARGLHGADDAAAGARDLLVAGAVEPQRELMRALAPVDEVGVAVDQPGRDQRARTVVARPARQQLGRQTIRRAGVDDVPALNGDHAGRRRQLAAQQGIDVQQAQVVPQAVGAERVGWNAIDHVAARAG